MDPDVAAIERAAYEAWPAAEVAELGGWRLRFNHGVTNRGNSVWPGPGSGSEAASGEDVASRIATAEAFYAERGRRAIFQLVPVAAPASLDGALAARGYEAFSPVHVQTAEAAAIAALPAPPGLELGCDDAPSEAWLDLATRRGRYTGVSAGVFLAMLGRLAGRAGFAWAAGEQSLAATGLVVAAPPWAGIFAMRTLEASRGRGLGRAVLRALAGWAVGRGSRRLYLQVEQDNPAALGLYERAGFETRYDYHYRRPAGGSA